MVFTPKDFLCNHKRRDKLDNVTEDIYKELSMDYYPINNIFFDIADELGLI